MVKAEDIDVFDYLEEVLMKKDLDDDDWYRARTISMIEGFVDSLYSDLVGFIEVGEGVSGKVAKKSVEIFRKDLREEKRKLGDEPIDVTEGEYDY